MGGRNLRTLPKWAWFLAVMFFPPGIFIAFGATRLLSWAKSVLLAILSYVSMAGFAALMGALEERQAGPLPRSAALGFGLLVFTAWGRCLYRIGDKASYWSPSARKNWRHAGWLVVALLGLQLLSVVLILVILYLQNN